MVQDNFKYHLIFYACLVVRSKIVKWLMQSAPNKPLHMERVMRTYYLEIISWSKSQVLKLHFCPTQLSAACLLPSSTFHQLQISCINVSITRLTGWEWFLFWASSRIHQPHTHIFTCKSLEKQKCLTACKRWLSFAWIPPWKMLILEHQWEIEVSELTVLHDFINRRSLHYHVCLQSGNLLDV